MAMCPYLSGLDKKGALVKTECVEYECAKYIQVSGTSPQTGQPVDDWKCSDAWLPVLLIENSQQQHQTGAAVESFRNEMVRSNQAVIALAAQPLKRIS